MTIDDGREPKIHDIVKIVSCSLGERRCASIGAIGEIVSLNNEGDAHILVGDIRLHYHHRDEYIIVQPEAEKPKTCECGDPMGRHSGNVGSCDSCGCKKYRPSPSAPDVKLVEACEAMEKEYLSTEFAGDEHKEYTHILHHVRLVIEALAAYRGSQKS